MVLPLIGAAAGLLGKAGAAGGVLGKAGGLLGKLGGLFGKKKKKKAKAEGQGPEQQQMQQMMKMISGQLQKMTSMLKNLFQGPQDLMNPTKLNAGFGQAQNPAQFLNISQTVINNFIR